MTALDEWSARHNDLWQHTKLTRQAIHAPGGIRTRNLSNRAAIDPQTAGSLGSASAKYFIIILMGYDLGAISVHYFSQYVAHPDYMPCIWICESWDVRSGAANLNIIPFFWDMPPHYCEIGIRCFEATYRLNLQRSKCTGRSGTASSSNRMKASTLHL